MLHFDGRAGPLSEQCTVPQHDHGKGDGCTDSCHCMDSEDQYHIDWFASPPAIDAHHQIRASSITQSASEVNCPRMKMKLAELYKLGSPVIQDPKAAGTAGSASASRQAWKQWPAYQRMLGTTFHSHQLSLPAYMQSCARNLYLFMMVSHGTKLLNCGA